MNKLHDAFENVKADPGIKESTRKFLAEKRRKKISFLSYPPVRRVFAAACMLAALVMGIGGYSWLSAPVSYVSIDVNPSMELALNRLDRVVSVTAYNPQGTELLERLPLKGKKYVQAILMISESDTLQKYLSADQELVITVAADRSRERTLKAGVERCCSHIGHGSRSVSVNLEVASEAHGNGLSVGKYSAYLQLTQFDDSVTVDECKDMSMTEIHCRIIEHVHGNGHGHGAAQKTEGTAEEQGTGHAAENEGAADTAGEQGTGHAAENEGTADTSGQQEMEDVSEEDARDQEGNQGHPHRWQQEHHGGH